jgi:hypothetical protein
MAASGMARPPARRRARRVAFGVWAAVLSLFFGLGLSGLTVVTIGMWLADHGYNDTNPVVDLGFFALGAVLIGSGFVVQVWAPEHAIAGVQQAVIGLVALTVAGWIGDRIEPLIGGVLFLLAVGVMAVLHPARGEFVRRGRGVSVRLVVVSIVGGVPAVGYAARMLGLAREAGPSCFLGRCARGDRYAEMAALAIAVVLVGLLAALKTPGWRLPAWSAGTAAILVGLACIALPDVPGAVGRVGGSLAIGWGVLFVAVAEREARGSTAP